MRVGTKFDQPLFGLKGLDGKPVGFDVEIAKIVAAKLGIPADKITYTETPSKIREDVLANNQVDMVVATYTINDARKQKVSFAGPYYVAGQDLMVKADNTTITGPESLKAANARVCSVSGSTPAKNIAKYVDAGNIVLFDVYSKCADALRNGQVEAVTTDNVILSGLVSTSQGAFKLVGKSFTKEPYGIGIAKGDTAFCQFIDDALKASVADGTLRGGVEGHGGHGADRGADAADRRHLQLTSRAGRPVGGGRLATTWLLVEGGRVGGTVVARRFCRACVPAGAWRRWRARCARTGRCWPVSSPPVRPGRWSRSGCSGGAGAATRWAARRVTGWCCVRAARRSRRSRPPLLIRPSRSRTRRRGATTPAGTASGRCGEACRRGHHPAPGGRSRPLPGTEPARGTAGPR